MRVFTAVATLLSVGFLASPVPAKSLRFNLGVSVPQVCHASFGGGTAPQGAESATLGPVKALCNDSAALAIRVSHPQGDAAEGISFSFRGVTVPASRSGVTVLSTTNSPVNRTDTLRLEADAPLPDAFPVSLSATVNGGAATRLASAAPSPRRFSGASVASFGRTGAPAPAGRNATLLSTGGSSGFFSRLFD